MHAYGSHWPTALQQVEEEVCTTVSSTPAQQLPVYMVTCIELQELSHGWS